MASRVAIDFDSDLLARARELRGGASDQTDSELIEEVVAAHLGLQAAEDIRTTIGGLDEEDANRIALEEVHAVREARRENA
jgi:hypothetical protein